MKSRVWTYSEKELGFYDGIELLSDTEYLVSSVSVALGLRSKIDHSVHEIIDDFTLWALRKLFVACIEVAWRCGLTFIKRQFRRAE